MVVRIDDEREVVGQFPATEELQRVIGQLRRRAGIDEQNLAPRALDVVCTRYQLGNLPSADRSLVAGEAAQHHEDRGRPGGQ